MLAFWLSTILSALGVLGSLVWIKLFLSAARNRHAIRKLSDVPANRPDGDWPALAVIFAARDEAGEVEAAARSILKLDYPELRVVAVDDRSQDETGAILDRLAGEDSRLAVVHVTELPPGWLGKTHALQLASEATDASWLLFTDADVLFGPQSLRKAIAFAESTKADHLIVPPDIPTEHFGERLFLVMFQLV
ncbi:MAG TPA: glycosyltransferase, partial [Isosphaeraceae bacterium]|nr:glycosyltransferase [Isosphaeraceae bacterium]